MINNCEIIDHGGNCSDHLPISCRVCIRKKFDKKSPKLNNIKMPLMQGWDKADLFSYYFETGRLLQQIKIPYSLCICSYGCSCNEHYKAIDTYYNNLVNCLKIASNTCVPKIPYVSLKSYWNEELNKYTEISIDMHKTLETNKESKRQGHKYGTYEGQIRLQYLHSICIFQIKILSISGNVGIQNLIAVELFHRQ